MLKILLTLFLIFSLTHSAMATMSEAHLLDKIIALSKDKNPDKAKEYLTPESHAVYDRLYKHDLTHLIPSKVIEVKKEQRGNYHYVWFTDDKHPTKSSILAFKNDNNLLKLDLPETFTIGFGKDWTKTLDLIEQSYLLAQQYYGEEKSKELLEALLQK